MFDTEQQNKISDLRSRISSYKNEKTEIDRQIAQAEHDLKMALAEDNFYNIAITVRPDKTQADVPTGFRIKSGTGIDYDPYIFELVYADDVPGDAVAATVNANELTYDGTEQSLVTVTGEANGGTMQYALGTATEATEPYSTTVPEGKDAGTYYVWYKAVGDASHNDSEEGQVSVTISPKDLTITAKANSKVYGDADPELEYEEKGLVSGDSITGNLARGEGETVGSYAISQGTLTAGDNYNIRYTGAVFTIGKKSIRITADSVSKTYGEDDPELTYTVEGLVDGDSLTGGLERVQGEDSGTYAINQGTLGGDNYEVESFTNGVFTIEKADSSMEEPTANVLTYNGGPQPLLASPGSTEDGTMLYSLDGQQFGDAIPEAADAGQYTVYYKVSGDDNHEDSEPGQISVTILPKTVTVTADPQSKTYGEPDPELTYSVNGLEGDDVMEGSLEREEGEDARTYAIYKGSLTAGDNYSISYTGANFTIGRKTLSIKARRTSKVYGDADPEKLEYDVEGLLKNDELTGELVRGSGEDAGTYAISQGTLSAGGNYDTTYTAAVFTINKAESNSTEPTANELTYDGTAQALVAEGTPEGGKLVYSLDGRTFSEDIPVGTDAGKYIVYYRVDGDDNHEDSAEGQVVVTILPKELTITADAKDKTYGDADPEFTYTYEGLLDGDEITGVLEREAGEDVKTYEIKQGSLTAGDNYSIVYNKADFTINKKGIKGRQQSNMLIHPTEMHLHILHLVYPPSNIQLTGMFNINGRQRNQGQDRQHNQTKAPFLIRIQKKYLKNIPLIEEIARFR